MSLSPVAHRASVVVIGGGQAGLAMSACLSQSSIDHVVLERGAIANSWRTQRWDSLRLLTPNWMTRLPGFRYGGPDPDGYMTATEVASFLEHYQRAIDAPIVAEAPVENVIPVDGGYHVVTPGRSWTCRAVVVATGACSTPRIPALATALPREIHQVAPIDYRNSRSIPDGRVLVVGASASGAQIADELARTGRNVTIAAGNHVRLPRTYRGMDIHWWLEQIGVLDEQWTDIDDLLKARRTPSLQLVGSDDRRNLGLGDLAAVGVQVVGRLAGISGSQFQISGSLTNTLRSADLKQNRLLDRIDDHARLVGLEREIGPTSRPEPTPIPDPVLALSMGEFDTVIWATGFRPTYPWLPPELVDGRGALRHNGGVMPLAGLYVLGLPFQRQRNSAFIDGVGRDAEALLPHLRNHLDATAASPSTR